jgi:type IV pilus assembly protein PilV
MRHRDCKGFALTELLVAAGLLAVGLLGHVALLVAGLHVERDATNRATAATLAADLGERIRANHAAGPAYALDPDDAPVSPAPTCAMATPFDAATRAACDLTEWQQDVEQALPGAEVSLSVDPVSGTTALLYSIEVRWMAGRDGMDGQFSLQLQVQ